MKYKHNFSRLYSNKIDIGNRGQMMPTIDSIDNYERAFVMKSLTSVGTFANYPYNYEGSFL